KCRQRLRRACRLDIGPMQRRVMDCPSADSAGSRSSGSGRSFGSPTPLSDPSCPSSSPAVRMPNAIRPEVATGNDSLCLRVEDAEDELEHARRTSLGHFASIKQVCLNAKWLQVLGLTVTWWISAIA
ncbi:unnamed protein product, partial [Polarella glacialis]